ncbi:MAG: DNA repair protein RecN [Candidatus Latescibacteria bacterium]|nr:DNA repair protein RecN [Candidatus Latescibacterota bacterium]
MLSRLSIHNLALIEEVDVEFDGGFTIMTGETGAGKSILIEGLEWVLGGRGGTDMIRSGTDRCIVEAGFTIDSEGYTGKRLRDLGIEEGEEYGEVLLRRMITPDGRGRCQMNGVTVSVRMLREVGSLLVDIHGQHDHQSLLDVERHREFLDAFGGYRERLEQVSAAYGALQTAERRLADDHERERLASERHELAEFQLREIEAVDPQPGEDETLTQELTVFEHAELLLNTAFVMKNLLYDGQRSIADLLGEAVRAVEEAVSTDRRLTEPLERITSLRYEAEDLATYFREYAEQIVFNPAHLERIRERIATLSRLKKKHGGGLREVLVRREELRRELSLSDELRKIIVEGEREVEQLREHLGRLCTELSRERRDAANRLETEVERMLGKLGIPSAIFRVDLQTGMSDRGGVEIDGQRYTVSAHGVEAVEFFLSTNAGEEPKPLVRVASGGEVSRVMLALKSTFAATDATPTLVFDEIDTGISGRIAEAVGRALLDLSAFHQVICITHLPQIASMGSSHISVVKTEKKGRTITDVHRLTPDERKEEIARLLGGEQISFVTRRHAEELLSKGE